MPDDIESNNEPNPDAPKVDASNESLTSFLEKSVKGFEKADETADDNVGEVDDKKIETDNESKTDETKKTDEEGKKTDDETKKVDDETKKVDDEAKKSVDDEGKKPVPYERFETVNRERTEYKAQLDEAKPKVENFERIATFCAENRITPEQFETAMKVQGLLNTNPEEALKHLLPIIEQLQGYVGNKLPDDLQKKVDDGKMELADAREFAKLRAKLQFGDRQVKQTQEQLAQARQQEQMKQYSAQASTWVKQKMSSDPDFKPKAKPTDPDGLFEDVNDKYTALLGQVDAQGRHVNPVNNPAEMVVLMQRAYDHVKTKWSKNFSKNLKPTGKRLSSAGADNLEANGETIEGAKSMQEAIAIGLRQRVRG